MKMIEEEKDRTFHDDTAARPEVLEASAKRYEALADKMDRILLDVELKNTDLLDLSSSMPSRVNVTYDLKSLIKSEFIYDLDPDLQNNGITADEFLEIHRRRAESKLIKTKIIYKLYHTNNDLSENESKYLKAWVGSIKHD
jgi:hypothetical protein